MATLTDFQTKFGQVLQDDAGEISTTERDAYIAEAVRAYSKDRPRIIVGAITGAGTYEYSLPTGWDDNFSVVKAVEYPAGNQTPTYLDEDYWLIYQGTTGKKLRFLSYTPTTAETINVTITAKHTVSAASGTVSGTSTVPDVDQDAVINLAAAIACYALGRKYAQSIEPTIAADSVNHLQKSGEYAKRGQELEKLYRNHLAPAKDGQVTAASVTGDWDSLAGWQDDRLTHPKRYR